jgi:hypothetical protein
MANSHNLGGNMPQDGQMPCENLTLGKRGMFRAEA